MAVAVGVALFAAACGGSQGRRIPAPALDDALAAGAAPRSIVLAGGCFWGVQEVYEHTRGVLSATSGYAGGAADTAHYDEVSSGATGHAESVRVVYDPGQLTLGQILQVFFSVVANPTEWNRQGPDVGSQYRTVIFYANSDQARIARAYISQLDAAHAYPRAIVTELTPLTPARAFYTAEAYHQDYARLHPNSSYIRVYDLPKLTELKTLWPALSR
ncbi:MAG TPA: peptide-methionine (S)-S-oxide reductase MsrA [Terriglobales bacterium]|nr:peptide-methionine (S)-S-oxide reductase MsrA [Terriglobales bacterium]